MAATEKEAERTAELRKKVEYQVACEERAHKIVERLIDNPVTQEQLINALHYITQAHYSDIVEERAVSKLCGNPLCPNRLNDIPKQKYMISTKTNKVYDIQSRKNFCSAKCYKASKHLECQVSNDPVWSRKNLQPTLFDLLPLDMQIGKLGEEVVVSKAGDIIEDLSKLQKLEKYEKNLVERIHEHNLEQWKIEETEESGNHGDKETPDGEKKNTGVDDSLVYTLDKAMGELNIESKGSGKDKGKYKQNVNSVVESNNSIDNGNEKHSEIPVHSELEEKDSCHEVRSTNVDKEVKLKHSKRSKVVNSNKSKTDYLMQLLDKRKNLLAKMADIQNDSQSGENKSEHVIESRETRNIDVAETNGKTADNAKAKEENKAELTEVSVKLGEAGELKSTQKSYCKTVEEKRKEKMRGASEDGTKKKNAVSALDIICCSVKSWITVNTVEYLMVDDEDTAATGKPKTAFEKQYQELVAKVDAQERDFDALLGEESMDSAYTDRSSAPLPHFSVLQQEMEGDQARVSEFMRGTFTYKVTEKQTTTKETDGSKGIILPTVDRYDQMLIRQKIVLDRISKVLPDVLSPLHLLVQDVFTDLRKMICTFSLTSDNIIFKPAEWTLVTLILLRMLSRRLVILQRSFKSPGAQKHFTVLLSTLGTSIDSIDVVVDNFLKLGKQKYAHTSTV